jgi:hypothetical protein
MTCPLGQVGNLSYFAHPLLITPIREGIAHFNSKFRQISGLLAAILRLDS